MIVHDMRDLHLGFTKMEKVIGKIQLQHPCQEESFQKDLIIMSQLEETEMKSQAMDGYMIKTTRKFKRKMIRSLFWLTKKAIVPTLKCLTPNVKLLLIGGTKMEVNGKWSEISGI